MKAKQFTNLELGTTIYNNRDGRILDIIALFEEVDNKYSEGGQKGYTECLNALRKGRSNYEETIYKIELKDHRHWNKYTRGDYNLITNHSLYRGVVDYELSNMAFKIETIANMAGVQFNELNNFF